MLPEEHTVYYTSAPRTALATTQFLGPIQTLKPFMAWDWAIRGTPFPDYIHLSHLIWQGKHDACTIFQGSIFPYGTVYLPFPFKVRLATSLLSFWKSLKTSLIRPGDPRVAKIFLMALLWLIFSFFPYDLCVLLFYITLSFS